MSHSKSLEELDAPYIIYAWTVTANMKNKKSGRVKQITLTVKASEPTYAIRMFDEEQRTRTRVSDAFCVCLFVAMVIVAGQILPKIEVDKYPLYEGPKKPAQAQ